MFMHLAYPPVLLCGAGSSLVQTSMGNGLRIDLKTKPSHPAVTGLLSMDHHTGGSVAPRSYGHQHQHAPDTETAKATRQL